MAARPKTTPRKLPTQSRAKATVDNILKAAALVLVAEGFEKTTTNLVAKRAGISIGSLYQYFPSKEALVAALIERHAAEMRRALSEAIATSTATSPEEATAAAVRALVQAHRVHPKLHAALLQQIPRVGRPQLDAFHREAERVVQGGLEAFGSSVRPTNAELAAFVLVHAFAGVTQTLLCERRKFDAAEVVRELTAFVIGYLRPSRGPEPKPLS
jgi:AcrR family transcriptional regulator